MDRLGMGRSVDMPACCGNGNTLSVWTGGKAQSEDLTPNDSRMMSQNEPFVSRTLVEAVTLRTEKRSD